MLATDQRGAPALRRWARTGVSAFALLALFQGSWIAMNGSFDLLEDLAVGLLLFGAAFALFYARAALPKADVRSFVQPESTPLRRDTGRKSA